MSVFDQVPEGLKPDPVLDAWLQRQQSKLTDRWPAAAELQQGFKAAVSDLRDTLERCPDDRWETSLWEVTPADPWMTPARGEGDRPASAMQVFSAFWYVAYHAIFFLDIDFTLLSGKPYKMPKPFGGEAEHGVDENQVAVLPYRVYTRAELLEYLAYAARQAEKVLGSITGEQAERRCPPGSSRAGRKFGEVLAANLQHLREHSSQLADHNSR